MARLWFNRNNQQKLTDHSPVTPPYPVPYGDTQAAVALANFIARNRDNQIESRPLFPETIELPEAQQEILNASRFNNLRKRMAFNASIEGKRYTAYIPYGNSFYMADLEVLNFKELANGELKWIELTGTNTEYTFTDGSVAQINLRLELTEDGKTKMTKFIFVEDEDQNIEVKTLKGTYIYPNIVGRLAGQWFSANTSRYASDIVYAGVEHLLGSYNYHVNELDTEWKHVATRMKNNENFSDMTDAEVNKIIQQGVRVMSDSSYNGKLQTGVDIFTSGSQSITFNQININFLEDKILKYAGIQRESTSTGSNKHSLEITLQNQYATEVLYSIRDQREYEWKQLFKQLAILTGTEDYSDELELKVSLIEEAKLALLNESVEQAQMKGSQNPKKQQKEE